MEQNILLPEAIIDGSFKQRFLKEFGKKYRHLFRLRPEILKDVIEEAKKVFVEGPLLDRYARMNDLMDRKPGIANFVIDIARLKEDIDRLKQEAA